MMWNSIVSVPDHCLFHLVVNFSIMITSWVERELDALIFLYFATFIQFVIICFLFLSVPLKGYDLCLGIFLHSSFMILLNLVL